MDLRICHNYNAHGRKKLTLLEGIGGLETANASAIVSNWLKLGGRGIDTVKGSDMQRRSGAYTFGGAHSKDYSIFGSIFPRLPMYL